MHVVNLGITYEEINRIPLQYLIKVELNDGTLPGNPRRDTAKAGDSVERASSTSRVLSSA